jgi:hypothetical protein
MGQFRINLEIFQQDAKGNYLRQKACLVAREDYLMA